MHRYLDGSLLCCGTHQLTTKLGARVGSEYTVVLFRLGSTSACRYFSFVAMARLPWRRSDAALAGPVNRLLINAECLRRVSPDYSV